MSTALTASVSTSWYEVPPRQLEDEVMLSREEVEAYDQLTVKHLDIVHAGFVETIVNCSPPRGKFLDVGCGPGWISIGVAKSTSSEVRIVALDLSETMLEVAHDNARREGVAERIDFRVGDAKALPFEAHTFDAVFCHNVLHHIPEPARMIREIRRVVRPDGSVCVRDLVRKQRWLIPVFVKVFGMPYDRIMKQEYEASLRAALSSEEWQSLCKQSGIADLRVTSCWVTHQGMERPAAHTPEARVYARSQGWLNNHLKRLYVTV